MPVESGLLTQACGLHRGAGRVRGPPATPGSGTVGAHALICECALMVFDTNKQHISRKSLQLHHKIFCNLDGRFKAADIVHEVCAHGRGTAVGRAGSGDKFPGDMGHRCV